MIGWIVVGVLVGLAAITVSLWKFGFVHDAQSPVSSEEKPMADPRQRKALLSRLQRWREEGKLTRAEYERVLSLCESDW